METLFAGLFTALAVYKFMHRAPLEGFRENCDRGSPGMTSQTTEG